MTENFIIFLDIDGVLCDCYGRRCPRYVDGEHEFKPESIEALNTIIQFYNADLCMISAWNSKFRDETSYKEFLESRGIIVNGLMFGNQHNRSEMILEMIDEGLKYYLIIDDEAHQFYINIPKIEYKRILQPNRYRCLDMYDTKMATFNWKLDV
jgi:hypothetical protein